MTNKNKGNKKQQTSNNKKEEKKPVDAMVDEDVVENKTETPSKSQQGTKRKQETSSTTTVEATLESATKKPKKEESVSDITGAFNTSSNSKIYKNILLVSNLSLSVDETTLKGCMAEIAESTNDPNQKVQKILIFQKNLSAKDSENLVKHALKNAQKNTNQKQSLVSTLPGPKAAVVVFAKDFENSHIFEDYNGAIIEGLPVKIRFACENDKACFVVVKGAPITEEELWSYVEECGKIASVESSKTSRNQFMVVFKEWESVRECLLFNGADIHGAPCRIFACMFPAHSESSTSKPSGKPHYKKGGNKQAAQK